jgi:hypothetical protein
VVSYDVEDSCVASVSDLREELLIQLRLIHLHSGRRSEAQSANFSHHLAAPATPNIENGKQSSLLLAQRAQQISAGPVPKTSFSKLSGPQDVPGCTSGDQMRQQIDGHLDTTNLIEHDLTSQLARDRS